MQTIAAFTSLWWGLRNPTRVDRPTPQAAVAIFAAAVLVLTLASTLTVYLEQGSVALQQESQAINAAGPGAIQSGSAVDTSTAGRQFTAVFGGALVLHVGSMVLMAGFFWMMMRFLTNVTVGYSLALAASSAVAGVEIVKMAFYTATHLATGTLRAGLHAGLAVSPTDHAFLFLWLQRIDLFSLWQYVAAGVCLAIWSSQHYRYGIAVGAVVFLVIQILMGGLTLVAWVVSQGM